MNLGMKTPFIEEGRALGFIIFQTLALSEKEVKTGEGNLPQNTARGLSACDQREAGYVTYLAYVPNYYNGYLGSQRENSVQATSMHFSCLLHV